jgi:AcrR family transcriptional regulator
MARVKTADKERAILDAASRVFAEREFHEVLIDDVAEAAGTGKGTIYRYFETKDELYLATLAHGFEVLLEALAPNLRERAPARRLEGIARETLRFSWNQQHLYMLLNRDEARLREPQAKLKKNRERVVRLVQEAIVEGIGSGAFQGVDPRLGAELFLGMIRAANCFRRDDDTLEGLVREIVGTFLHGISRGKSA